MRKIECLSVSAFCCFAQLSRSSVSRSLATAEAEVITRQKKKAHEVCFYSILPLGVVAMSVPSGRFSSIHRTLTSICLFPCCLFLLQKLLAGIKAKKAAKFTADKEALVQKLKSEQAAAPAAL